MDKKFILTIALAAFLVSATALSGAQDQCASIEAGLPNVATLAPWYCPINQQIGSLWSGYVGYAVIAVLIAFGIAAMIFMVGAATKDERIRTYGVGEIYEALASAIIVGMFLYIAAALFGYFPATFVGQINPYAISLHFINGLINQTGTLYHAMFLAQFKINLVASYKLDITVPALNALSVGAGFIPIGTQLLGYLFTEPVKLFLPFLVDAIWVLYTEYYLIIFFAIAALPVFIIPGVILRAFIPTRSLGGMMIAMGIGFYLIMPTLFSVVYYFVSPSLQAQMAAEAAQVNVLANSNNNAVANAQSATSPLVTELGTITSTINTFWLLILFFPPTIAGMMYAMIIQIAEFIGGASQTVTRLRVFGGL